MEIRCAGGAFFTTDGERITAPWMLGDADEVKPQLRAGQGNRLSGGGFRHRICCDS